MSTEYEKLPSPIAFALARAAQAPVDRRLQPLIDAAERSVRYLTLVATARYIGPPPEVGTPPEERGTRAHAALRALESRASFGKWCAALVEVEKLFRDDPTFAVPLDVELNLPHALEIFCRKREWTKSEISASQALKALVELRNDFAHASPAMSESETQQLVQLTEGAILELLRALSVHELAMPVLVKNIDPLRKSWKLDTIDFAGTTKTALHSEDLDEQPPDFVRTGQVVLYRNGHPSMSLSPWIVSRDNRLYLLRKFPGWKPIYEAADPELDHFDPRVEDIVTHFEEVAGHLMESADESPASTYGEDALKIALETARADGIITPDELAMLEAIRLRFNLPELGIPAHELHHLSDVDTEAEDDRVGGRRPSSSGGPERRRPPAAERAPIDGEGTKPSTYGSPFKELLDASMRGEATADDLKEIVSGAFNSVKKRWSENYSAGELDWTGWEAVAPKAVLDFRVVGSGGQFRLKFKRNEIPLVLQIRVEDEDAAVELLFDDHQLCETRAAVEAGGLQFTMRLPFEGPREMTIDCKSRAIRIRTRLLVKSESFEAYVRF